MDTQAMTWIVAVVGVLLMGGLSINGFFLKEIINGLSDVKVRLAELAAESKGDSKRIDLLYVNQEKIECEIRQCREAKHEMINHMQGYELRIQSLEDKL